MAYGATEYGSLSSYSSDISTVSQPSFVHVDDRFLCPVCKTILKIPMQTACGHRMCEGCIKTVFAEGEPAKCPASDKDDPCEPIYQKQVFRDVSARREIGQLPVFCGNAHLGCTMTVPWKDLDKHTRKCPYTGTDCPNKQYGCSMILPAKDIDGHVQKACQFRQVTCRQCEASYSFKDEKKHQEEECPETVTSCPFHCAAKPMKRKDFIHNLKAGPLLYLRLHLHLR